MIDFPRFATVISLFGVIGGEADLRGLFDSVEALRWQGPADTVPDYLAVRTMPA